MIISKTISVQLQSVNISYFEKLGYSIPKYLDKYGRLKIKRGTKIQVKVSDLSSNSHTKVICKCSCGKERLIVFNTVKEKYVCQQCCKQKEKNPKWNPTLTSKERKQRHNISGIWLWRKQVKERDNHTCQKCGSKKYLQVHHIDNFSNFKEQRTMIDNGITLCFECHIAKNGRSIHSIYGDFTTKEMLNEFMDKSNSKNISNHSH